MPTSSVSAATVLRKPRADVLDAQFVGAFCHRPAKLSGRGVRLDDGRMTSCFLRYGKFRRSVSPATANPGRPYAPRMPAAIQRRDEIIENFVLPLATGTAEGPSGYLLHEMCGTGFLLKNGRGLGITARHVMRKLQESDATPVAVFRPQAGETRCHVIETFDLHPTEDVALFRIADDDYSSPFVVGQTKQPVASQYTLWGYPEDVYYDRLSELGGLLQVDLVFSRGHVRRLVNYRIALIPGEHFYELSTPAGGGCSGSAVTMDPQAWRVDGIYVGERRSEANTFAVGYAVRSEVLVERWPQLIGENGDLSTLCPLPGVAGEPDHPTSPPARRP